MSRLFSTQCHDDTKSLRANYFFRIVAEPKERNSHDLFTNPLRNSLLEDNFHHPNTFLHDLWNRHIPWLLDGPLLHSSTLPARRSLPDFRGTGSSTSCENTLRDALFGGMIWTSCTISFTTCGTGTPVICSTVRLLNLLLHNPWCGQQHPRLLDDPLFALVDLIISTIFSKI